MNRKKRIFLWTLALLATAALLLLLLYLCLPRTPRTYGNADFQIPDYYSSTDMDGDGVDDQSDILQSVRAYLDTKPKYRSKYYAGGYPDDEYGVCTDVVAFGLLGAGYDLRALVEQDILENPDDYAIETPDADIDFRRVRNLLVYFQHSAIALTCDPADIAQWQGGDIVVFSEHIGVVSDRRNADGFAYVLHHGSPLQAVYEEDILEARAPDIVGHFRIS